MPQQTPKLFLGLFSLLFLLPHADAAVFEPMSQSFESAKVQTSGNELIITTGRVERRWAWREGGLATIGLRDLRSGHQWVEQIGNKTADWSFPGLSEGKAKLLALTARQSDDQGFTSPHLEVVAEILYPETRTSLKYVVWAYPNAPGLRSQIWLKGEPHVYAKSQNGIKLVVVSGRPFKIPARQAEHTVAPSYHTSNLYDPKAVEIQIQSMKRNRRYKAMLSWWDTGKNQRRIQSVQVMSMDGESSVVVIPPTALPAFRDGKRPVDIGFDIPPEVRIGDMVRVKVSKEKGVNAHLFEFWVYEEGPGPTDNELKGDAERIHQLEQHAPAGYHLAAYLDGGQASESQADQESGSGNRVDFLPVVGTKLTAFGYYNDTQHRHTINHHMYREESLKESSVDWASVLFAENSHGGIAWVKESHKCVNRSGVNTGEFIVDDAGLHNTGSALTAADLRPNEYRWCWASWTVLYPENSQYARELAMKQFDRARYPVDLDRDVFVKANTWGSGNSGAESMAMASEDQVLKEIDSVADLGIDILQIDDGWQCGRQQPPNTERPWHVREDWYPEGWQRVRKAAVEKHIKLGLWTAAYAKLDDLKRNFDDGGFVTWKYDFAHIANYDHLYHHWSKLRSFLLYTDHKARMAVDVTENAPRFGYFWARDFGCVWLSNRKPNNPPNTIPKPHLMLRENRELSRYVNLNKFELPIQNFQRVNRKQSDAYLYGHSYEVALGLMGIPTFFQTTYYYQGPARQEIRNLISIYKEHQPSLYQSYVFAIGDEPDNASWSGFQWLAPDSDEGYLLIFRERLNQDTQKAILLHGMQDGQRLEWINLRSNHQGISIVDDQGRISMQIKQPADFLFMKYQYKHN